MDNQATHRTIPEEPRSRLFKDRREMFIAFFFLVFVPGSYVSVISPIYNKINPSASISSFENDMLGRSMFFFFIFICPFGFVIYQSVTLKRDTMSLVDDDLVKKDVTYKDIISVMDRDRALVPATRDFSNPILVYISHGSERGYDLTRNFTSKFTHISPIWYTLRSEGNALYLEGKRNVNAQWILDVRRHGDAMVVPKFTIEATSSVLLKTKKQRASAIAIIVAECRRMKYDGMVLESWSRWEADDVLRDSTMRKMAFTFIEDLAYTLHDAAANEKRLDLIYIIPLRRRLLHNDSEPTDFGRADLERLNNYVDGFSLMTYDFSDADRPGPNAPLQWIRVHLDNLLHDAGTNLAQKIFFGLNFYGRDYRLARGGGDNAVALITGVQYRTQMEEHRPRMGWDNECGEHYFIYVDNDLRTHIVFYPSLLSIWIRLDEARARGIGIAINEVGAGLDSFLGLL